LIYPELPTRFIISNPVSEKTFCRKFVEDRSCRRSEFAVK
jgi:hypothetical protein